MRDPKSLALRVRRSFGPDPEQACAAHHLFIVSQPLVGLRGFLICINRRKFIFVSDDLPEQERRFVLWHELGHYLMHRKINRVFLDTRTFFKTSPYEKEANRFAAACLYPDDAELSCFIDMDLDSAAGCLGLPSDLARWRLEHIDYPLNLTL